MRDRVCRFLAHTRLSITCTTFPGSTASLNFWRHPCHPGNAPAISQRYQQAQYHKSSNGKQGKREQSRPEGTTHLLHTTKKRWEEEASQSSNGTHNSRRHADFDAKSLWHQLEYRPISHAETCHSNNHHHPHHAESRQDRPDRIEQPD